MLLLLNKNTTARASFTISISLLNTADVELTKKMSLAKTIADADDFENVVNTVFER